MYRKSDCSPSTASRGCGHTRGVVHGLFVLGVTLASVYWFSRSGRAQSENSADHAPMVATKAVPNAASDVASFHKNVTPVLKQYCYDCHGNGSKNGNLAFDELKDD